MAGSPVLIRACLERLGLSFGGHRRFVVCGPTGKKGEIQLKGSVCAGFFRSAPYTATPYAIERQMTLQHSDIANLTPTDISLQFGPAALNEKIGTWKDVYGIVERYRGKVLGVDGKAWLVEVLDESRCSNETAGAEGKAPDAYLRDVSRHTEKSPYANANFLKIVSFKAAKRWGCSIQS